MPSVTACSGVCKDHFEMVVTVVTLGPSLGILMDGAGGPKHSYRLRSLPCRRRPGTQWEDYDTTLRHDSGGESLKLVRRKSGFEAKASVHVINDHKCLYQSM